jgi:hypothetical protein
MDEDKYLCYIKNNDYQGLLECANKILTNKKDNNIALEYKAKALISLGQYYESYNILTSLLVKNNENLYELIKLNKALLDFESKYQHYSNLEYPKDWLKSLLLEQIEITEEEFLKINTSYSKSDLGPIYDEDADEYSQSKARVHLHNFLSNQFYDVFIVGPENVIEYFDGYYDIQKTHPQTILTYPFTQVNKNGYVYTKEQNYKLLFVYPLEDDNIWQGDEEECDKYFNYSPLFNAPFPVIDWYLDLNKVTMKHPRADVYLSNSIVNAYLHRMLISNLDKLASANKNYFVPMHHHIIDPNLTAVIQKVPDNDPTYQ